ncbi:hypothetical protein QAD02_001845 [Eretmocerus hayati]|uniref:Uncharacterized protein n=1 Tax=Eretmocerus hayati TaxID=131215 RepID=A0ACC2NIY8_9HYME|nr:hypothetical protein QAD02_001845 [Eretmocerus hayati]
MNLKKFEEHFQHPTMQSGTRKYLEESNNQKVDIGKLLKLNSSDAREFLCGWGAAVINVTVTYPVNKIIFRQMLDGVPASSAIEQLSNEGFRLLYRGILPPLCQKALCLSLMFSLYEGSNRRVNALWDHKTFSRIFAANFAGACEAILMPLERVQMLLQDYRYHNKFKNTPHAFSVLLREYGISECYRGLVPIIYRNGLSNLMFFTLKDQSKEIFGKDRSHLVNFFSGALIGGFTSTVFYPVNVVKVHMQSKIGGEFEKFTKCCRDVYIARNRSISGIYKGVHLNFMRSFISWGVVNVSYDFLKKLIL